MPKIICITGGIGSGKSTICRVFETWGVPVFRADDEARNAYRDPEIRSRVEEIAGPGIFSEAGELNSRALAARIFSDESILKKINALIHPWVRNRWLHWKSEQQSPYVIREAAILFESGSFADCDEIVLISAPEQVRIKRVMLRDKVSEVEVRNRMAAQWTDEQRREHVHREWVNDDSRLLLPLLSEAHREWLGE